MLPHSGLTRNNTHIIRDTEADIRRLDGPIINKTQSRQHPEIIEASLENDSKLCVLFRLRTRAILFLKGGCRDILFSWALKMEEN